MGQFLLIWFNDSIFSTGSRASLSLPSQVIKGSTSKRKTLFSTLTFRRKKYRIITTTYNCALKSPKLMHEWNTCSARYVIIGGRKRVVVNRLRRLRSIINQPPKTYRRVNETRGKNPHPVYITSLLYCHSFAWSFASLITWQSVWTQKGKKWNKSQKNIFLVGEIRARFTIVNEYRRKKGLKNEPRIRIPRRFRPSRESIYRSTARKLEE